MNIKDASNAMDIIFVVLICIGVFIFVYAITNFLVQNTEVPPPTKKLFPTLIAFITSIACGFFTVMFWSLRERTNTTNSINCEEKLK